MSKQLNNIFVLERLNETGKNNNSNFMNTISMAAE